MPFLSLKKSIVLVRLACLIFTFFILIPAHYARSGPHYTKFNRPIVDVFNDITKFLLSIVGGLAVFILIIAGVYYITSTGNSERQEKAKKMVRNCLFGLIFVLASYGMINQTSQISTDTVSTFPSTCYWECSEWSICAAGNQTRTCVNSCGIIINSPIVSQICVVLPASFDWSHKILPAAPPVGGADWMTSVKDQSMCGSCWAFSTLGYMEAMYNIQNSDATLDIDLSEQDLVSCSPGSCFGWSLPETADYIQNTGVVPDSCFIYSASDEACSVPNRCATWAAQLWKITTWSVLLSSNQQSIKNELVNGGPVLTGMNMSTWNPATESCASSTENHGVVIVGYDDAGGYWIVKNSYGVGWIDGINGYFKVKYGQCGLDSGITVDVENVLSP